MYLKNKIAVGTLFGISGFIFANFTSRLPQIKDLYELNNAQIGASLFLIALGAIVAMPLTGMMIVKKSSKYIGYIAALIYCALISFISFMPGAIGLNLLLFLIGLMNGTLDVAMNDQAILVEKKSKKPIMTSLHAIYSAGMMVGAGAGALALSQSASVGQHLLIVSIFTLALAIMTLPYLIRDQVEKVNKEAGFKFPKASLIGIGLIAFCCMLGEGAIANWSTTYMLDIAQTDASFAPMGLLAFSAAMMIARLFGDRARTAIGDQQLMLVNCIIAVAGLALVLILPNPVVSVFGFFLVGLGLSVIVPISYSTAGNTPDVPSSIGVGMVTTIGYTGLLLGPPLIGFIAEWQNMQVALLLTLLLFVLMTIFSWRSRQNSGRRLSNSF